MTELNVARTGLEDVEEALKDVIDPELGVNIVDLGLLYGLKYSDDDGALLIDMTLTTAAEGSLAERSEAREAVGI